MRAVAALVATIAACSDGPLVPVCYDGADCWPSPTGLLLGNDIPAIARTRPCLVGTVECGDGVAWCVDADLPVDEVCNGVDDDCNGLVDDGIDVSPLDEGNSCHECGQCAYAWQSCVAGAWTCVPSFPATSEVCNGLDDDCDCLIDEDIPAAFAYPEAQYPGTVGVGECRPDVTRCYAGREVYTAPVLPTEDVCNGLDDDCDGAIDDGLDRVPVAMMIAVDVSGSMTAVLDGVASGFCDFAVGSPLASRFAVVAFGYAGHPPSDVAILQDFDDAPSTCLTLSGLADFNGSTEYAAEAVLVAGGLAWPDEGDSSVVVVTDEMLQERVLGSISDVEDQCFYTVAVYTDPWYFREWESIISTCGGYASALDGDRYSFADDLLLTFAGACR